MLVRVGQGQECFLFCIFRVLENKGQDAAIFMWGYCGVFTDSEKYQLALGLEATHSTIKSKYKKQWLEQEQGEQEGQEDQGDQDDQEEQKDTFNNQR